MTTSIGTESAEWFAAAEQGRFLVQVCSSCGHRQHYPRSICTACGGTSLEFIESSGSGVVISWTTVHRSPDPEQFTPPYTLAVVELAEGVRCLARLEADDPRCDAPVTLQWDHRNDVSLPVFVQEEAD